MGPERVFSFHHKRPEEIIKRPQSPSSTPSREKPTKQAPKNPTKADSPPPVPSRLLIFMITIILTFLLLFIVYLSRNKN
jgi:hypothetical protein